MISETNAALSAKFGDGKYITTWWNPNLYIDYSLVEKRKLGRVEVENATQAFLRSYPGVEAVFTRTQVENGAMPNTKLAKQVILAWHQQISGDIVVMNKPNWYLFAKSRRLSYSHSSSSSHARRPVDHPSARCSVGATRAKSPRSIGGDHECPMVRLE